MFTCPNDVESCCCPAGYTYFAEMADGQEHSEECTGDDTVGTF
jgi:hypothetical protein